MLNPEKFTQDTPLKGIRSDQFYTIKKECFNDVTTDDNGAYLNSRSNKRAYALGVFNDGELQNVKIVHESNIPHGNAKTANASPYTRTSQKKLERKRTLLAEGHSVQGTYDLLIKESGGAYASSSQSTVPCNKRQLYNVNLERQ